MIITFEVEVPEKDMRRYLGAASAALGRNPTADFPWDLARFAKYTKEQSHGHDEFMGILIREAIEYLERD